MTLTVFSFASWGYQETPTFWFCLKREHSVTIMLQSLICFNYALLPSLPCPCLPSHCPSWTFYSPNRAPLLPAALPCLVWWCYKPHLSSTPQHYLPAKESVGPLRVFCSLFNQISPITYPEESDFGVTELSVEGGEIVRHHLKSPGPWMPGNCREKLIFPLFKAISFSSSFVKRIALGNESDGSPWTGTLHSTASLRCYATSIIPMQAQTHSTAKPAPYQSQWQETAIIKWVSLGLKTCSFPLPLLCSFQKTYHKLISSIKPVFYPKSRKAEKQGYARIQDSRMFLASTGLFLCRICVKLKQLDHCKSGVG